MKKYFLLPLILLLYSYSHAQIQWAQPTWGMQHYFLKVDPAGNCYLAMMNGDSATYQNIWLGGGSGMYGVTFAKYNTNGKLLWAGQTSGPAEMVYANAFDKYGNQFVAGAYTYEFTSPDVTIGSQSIPFNGALDNIFLAKLDTAGNAAWLKGIGCMNNSYVAGLNTDSGGNVYLIGTFNSPFTLDGVQLQPYGPGGSSDGYFLAKYDGNGNLLWIDSSICRGGAELKINDNGDIFFAGGFQNGISCHDTSITARGAAIYIEKQNSQGQRQWLINTAKSGRYYQSLLDYSLDKENNLYCLATLPDSFAINDTSMILPGAGNYVFCLDPNGNFKWVNKVRGPVAQTMHIYISPDDSLHAITEEYSLDTIWYSRDSILALLPKVDTFTDYVMNKVNGTCRSPRQLFTVTGYTTGNISADAHGNLYYFAGYQSYASIGTDSFGNGYYGCFLVKCESPGYNGLPPLPSIPPFSIAPNPVRNYVQIMPGCEGLYAADVIDISGRIVETYSNLNGTIMLPASKLASGVYTIHLINKNGYSQNARMVKE